MQDVSYHYSTNYSNCEEERKKSCMIGVLPIQVKSYIIRPYIDREYFRPELWSSAECRRFRIQVYSKFNRNSYSVMSKQ